MRNVAAQEGDLREARQGVRDPPLAQRWSENGQRLLQRSLCVIEAAARQREIGRSPQCAREPPAIAGAAKEIECFGDEALRGVVVTGGGFD